MLIMRQAHMYRRPIIVYSVDGFKNARGETLQKVRFQGIYLPLLSVIMLPIATDEGQVERHNLCEGPAHGGVHTGPFLCPL